MYRTIDDETNELTRRIIGCAMTVHSRLGPGLLENVYKQCLFYESRKNGLLVEKEYEMPLVYDEIRLDHGYRLDLFYKHRVIVEIKALEALNDLHIAQILTYLKLSGAQIGLLINFNVPSLRFGIKRLVY